MRHTSRHTRRHNGNFFGFEPGFTCVVPTEEEMAKYSTPAIALVKADRIAEGYDPAVECIRRLQQRGAAAVALGCTELPLAIPHQCRPELGLEIADPIDGLAAAAIRWYFDTRLSTGVVSAS